MTDTITGFVVGDTIRIPIYVDTETSPGSGTWEAVDLTGWTITGAIQRGRETPIPLEVTLSDQTADATKGRGEAVVESAGFTSGPYVGDFRFDSGDITHSSKFRLSLGEPVTEAP